MLPLGYMYKRISPRPKWLDAEHVVDVVSLSDCTSPNFTDWFSNTEHNGYYLFDSPEMIESLAKDYGVPLEGLSLLYFEAFEHEYDEEDHRWSAFAPNPTFATAVQAPAQPSLRGFDIACFESGGPPGCSPLSCNGLANSIPTDEHCLIRTLEEARDALEQGRIQACEPGPYRIIAVYAV